jgi:hypothetical protein
MGARRSSWRSKWFFVAGELPAEGDRVIDAVHLSPLPGYRLQVRSRNWDGVYKRCPRRGHAASVLGQSRDESDDRHKNRRTGARYHINPVDRHFDGSHAVERHLQR